MSEIKLNRVVFLGMDLAGKTEASAFAGSSLGQPVYGNLLGDDHSFYTEAVSRMRSEALTDSEQVDLFEQIYTHDLECLEQNPRLQGEPAIQDNMGILRVLSYSHHLGRNICGLLDIFRSYPSSDSAFYLTCSREERFRRLESRAGQKKEDIYEKLLRKDPESFFAIDAYALNLYRDSFGCEVIDTTGLSELEVFECVSEIMDAND